MDRLLSYSPIDAVYENLSEIAERENRLKEQELAHLRELAIEIASGFRDPAEFLVSLPNYRLPRNGISAETGVRRSVRLCTELAKLIPIPPVRWQRFFFQSPGPSEPDINRVIYQQNRLSDAAFYRFTEHLHNAVPIAAHSFRSICEEVSRGFAAFGMVPLESVGDERMIQFLKTVNEYDLRIVSSCEMRPEVGRSARFVLLAASLASVDQLLIPSLRFAFSLRPEEARPEEVLLAARQLRLSLLSATVTGEQPGALHALVRVGDGDLYAFLLYLAMEAPQYNPMGLYSD